MKPDEILTQAREEVLEEAYASLHSSSAAHYERQGESFTRARLGELFDLVVRTIDSRELAPLSTQVEAIATERFGGGFDISEVQSAFNALELAMWRRLVASTPPEDLAESIGLLSTVMGFAKDALARRYISLASDRHVHSLDLSALFTGVSS